MHGVVLSRRAERDLRRIASGDLDRIGGALTALATAADVNLDVKALAGAAPWLRLRVGDYRILYRAIQPEEGAQVDARWLVARVVQRRDLERAVATLK